MDEQPNRDAEPSSDASRKARELFERTAPVLRDVNARLERNEALRETRDALARRAGDLVSKADRALQDFTAIEGTVVDRPAGATPAAPQPEPATAATPKPSVETGDTLRQPHWNKARVARMAKAAAVEAVRPQKRPRVPEGARLRVAASALAAVLLLVLWRRRR